MTVTPLQIPDVLLITPRVFEDERGFFFESFNLKDFEQAVGNSIVFVQDNHSRSARGVVRGLHYQIPPNAQGKLVRVTLGEVFDVAVDIRKNSPTLGQWVGEYLTADNKHMLWIPPGFAHGFYVVSDEAEFQYKCSGYYSPEHERCICWDDPELNINWPIKGNVLLSDKDSSCTGFEKAELFVDNF